MLATNRTLTDAPDRELAPLFRQYLQARDDRAAERFRNSLIADHADAVVRRTILSTMRVRVGGNTQQGQQQEAAEDLYCDALVALGRQIDKWRRDPSAAPPPPEKFLDYVAVVTYNAWKHWLKKNRRRSVHQEIYYLLTRQDGLALWQTEEGIQLGGFSSWREEKKPPLSAQRVQSLSADPEAILQSGLKRRGHPRMTIQGDPAECLAAILDEAQAPVEFETLVSVWSTLRDEGEAPVKELSGSGRSKQGADEDQGPDVEDSSDLSVGRVEKQQELRDLLRKLWGHMQVLPQEQRTALLLNLQDGDIRDFPVMKIASFGEIAKALNKTPQQLAVIWNQLPLDDSAVAADLGITIERVKNLRQSAYRTLAWKLRPFDRGMLRRLWQEAMQLVHPRAAALMLYLRDEQASSILALLPRESIVGREEIARSLKLSDADLNRVWPELPLAFPKIGALLGHPPQKVVLFYQEANVALAGHLREMWKIA